jgi:hypothetical protein
MLPQKDAEIDEFGAMVEWSSAGEIGNSENNSTLHT